MSTDRRTLLGAGAALALPAWIARAFDERSAQAMTETKRGGPTLDGALERARAVGKPLLVILTDPEVADAHVGQVWGELFLHASEDLWLDLALVEVACLPKAAVAKLDGRGPCWAVLLETDGKPGGPSFAAGSLPFLSFVSEPPHLEQVRARVAALSALLRATILRSDATLERRRDQSIASLPNTMMSEPHGQLESVVEDLQPVRLVDLDRFAAPLRALPAATRLDRLALAARMRLVERDLDGAHWGTISNNCPPCGMGFTPPESRYFLRFYAS